MVMMLPLDIANSRGNGGGINTDVMWQILLLLFFVFLVFLIPYMILLYETDEESPLFGRLCRAFCYEFFFLLAATGLALIAFGTMRQATLSPLKSVSYSSFQKSEADLKISVQTSLKDINMVVPPFLFVVVFWIWIGWFAFVIFGGIGVIALPLDLILDYFYRPKPRTAAEIAERKILLRRKCEELLVFTKVIEDSEE